MALNQGNYYILVTESTVKLTYVRTVPEPGMIAAERDPEKGKRADNVRRAKTMFLDIGQSNSWDYMGTFTSACADPSSDIRAIPKWINNWNTNHHAKIRYLMIFELGEKVLGFMRMFYLKMFRLNLFVSILRLNILSFHVM